MKQQGKLEEFTNDLILNPPINYLVYRWVPNEKGVDAVVFSPKRQYFKSMGKNTTIF